MFTTSVLVPSAFGDNTFVGNAFVDISKAWAKGRFAVDSRVGYREHTKHFATAYAQTLQHWGVLFDHYFFPRDAKSPS
jgi:hypothetical protein